MISPNPFARSQKSRRRSAWSALAAALALVIVLCAGVIFWQRQLAGVLWQAGAPLLRLRNNAEQSSVSALEAELASTTAALADRNALYNQTIELKKMLNRPQTSTEVLGAVLQRPPGLPYDTLLIDVGSQNGLVVGDLVFAGGSAAIGDISDVYTGLARVSLFSAPGRTYDAEIAPAAAGGSVIPVSLEGQGAGSLSGEVPANSAAAVGDAVLIPGINNETLGSITHIDAPSGSSFETLYAQMPINIFSLQYVQVQTHI